MNTKIDPIVIQTSVFGSFDGMTSALGVIAAAYLTATPRFLVTAACGLAIAAAVSMAGGEFLSETQQSQGAVRRATIMAGATFIGAFLPALPFLLFAKPVALGVAVLLVMAAAVIIAQVRVSRHGWAKAYLQTFGILLCAGMLSIAVTLVFTVAP